MRAINVGAVVGCVGLTVLLVVPSLSAQQRDSHSHKRVRVEKLKPNHATELQLDEFWLTTDEDGRRKVTMSGGLKNGIVERLFWAVDIRDHSYSVVRLTGDHADDAKRIGMVYARLGYDLVADDIADKLRRNHLATEETHQKLKNDAEAAAAFNGAERVDDDHSRVHGPATGCETEGQWATNCTGFGWANVQTWEPARYLFNVQYLNETQTAASWVHHFPSGSFSITRSGNCWANPETFAYTHWYTVGCIPTFTSLANSFDSARVGQYVNYDFSLYLSGVPHAITITAEASVQSAYGMGIWGAQYWEDTQDWLKQWYEPFFLSGIISGAALEGDCQQSCEPSSLELGNCNDDNHTWDYELCQCINNQSPIIIDLSNDGLHLTGIPDGVEFDIEATGQVMRVGWTRAGSDDAFLVLDRNGNGVIDDGGDLFGNNAPQPPVQRKAERNGFRALAIFDEPAQGGNGDEQITAADAIFSSLRLWKDLNHDGISQPGELLRLDEEEVRGISLHYVRTKQVDEYGNALRYRSHVTMDRHAFDTGMRRQAIDVFLVAAQSTQ